MKIDTQAQQKFSASELNGLEYDKKGQLHFMGQNVAVLASDFASPLYVYSADLIRSALGELKAALDPIRHLICYAVKANSNLAVLKLLREAGCGADIVSGGELYRATKANIPPQSIVFSGTGKTAAELKMALEAGILLFSVESEAELVLLSRLSEGLGLKAQVSLRVNPALKLSTQSHPYISTGQEHDKFGMPFHQVIDLYRRACQWKGITIRSLGCHIGSQILDPSIFGKAAELLAQLASQLQSEGFIWEYVDMGGGLGVSYDGVEKALSLESYVRHISAHLPLKQTTLILEPGRFLLANAGILITQVLLRKSNGKKDFYVVDAAMNDLMRPALYQAHHTVLAHCQSRAESNSILNADLVGPVCESGDFFARDRKLPAFAAQDYAVICSAGAYGFSMSSNYNSRCRAAEVLIDGEQVSLVRKRESYADLISLERA